MRGFRRVACLFAALAVVTVACTSSEGTDGAGDGSEQVTLEFWQFEGDAGDPFWPALERDFEAANPNIDLNVTAFPEATYYTKLNVAIAADKAPDLVFAFDLNLKIEEQVLPLDDVVTENNIDLSTYVPSIVDEVEGDEYSCGWQGHLYCLGSHAGSVQMLYNKDLFDAAGIPYPAPWPPMTPDEFVDIACQLTDTENGVWGAAATDPTTYIAHDMLFSPDGRTATGYVNGPDFVHQVEVLASGYEQGCLPSSNVLDAFAQGHDFFSEGKLAMLIADFTGLPQVENAGINYGTTGLPTPAGVDPHFYTWTDSVGVMASSEHPDEAKAFVAFMATEGQRIRYETTGDIPLDLSIAEEVDWAAGIPGREDGLEVLGHARPLVFIPDRFSVLGPYNDAWGFVLSGEKTAQEALDDAAPAMQEELDKAWGEWDAEQG